MQADKIVVEGEVTEALPSANFRVKLDSGQTILCYLAGKMKMKYIKIVPGDRVRVEMSPYDLERGRIVWRLK